MTPSHPAVDAHFAWQSASAMVPHDDDGGLFTFVIPALVAMGLNWLKLLELSTCSDDIAARRTTGIYLIDMVR